MDGHSLAYLGEVIGTDDASTAEAEPALRHEQVITETVVDEAGRSAHFDERRRDVEVTAHRHVRRPDPAQHRRAVQQERNRAPLPKGRRAIEETPGPVIARQGEQRLGQTLVHDANEARGGAVRVPEVSERDETGPSVVERRQRGRHDLQGEPFGEHIDIERRVIARGDDDVEAWSIGGQVLLDVREQRLVLYSPFVAGPAAVDGTSSMDLVEALRSTELADALPAEIAGVKHARAATKSSEDRRRRRRKWPARCGMMVRVHIDVR